MKYIYSSEKNKKMSFSVSEFTAPETQFYPMYSWVWNSPTEKKEIKRQIDLFAECNIRQIYILPEPKGFRPATMPTTMEPEYLTEEYFEIYRYAIEYAEKKGMELWLYDEGGWPSGGACGQVLEKKPYLAEKRLSVRLADSPYIPSENAIAGYCGGKRIQQGFASEQPIYEYYMEDIEMSKYPNMSEEEAVDTFIEITHEQYKKYIGNKFGNSITAVFTDEPSVKRTGFYKGFENKFLERYGYDLRDYLPAIITEQEEDADEVCQQVRIDYFDLIAEAFAENFFIKSRKWCRDNKLLFTGHLNGEDETLNYHRGFFSILRQLRCFDIPGVDTIWRQIFAGNKNHFFPRFAGSAANQTGSPYAMSESFAIYGAGLTFEQMRYVMLYQMSRGINKINIMWVNYSNDGLYRRDARPGFMPLIPQWRHLKKYNEYVARLSYLVSLGVPDILYAVYMPMHDLWAGGKRAEKAAESFDETVYALEKKHCPADIIDDDFLETAQMCNGVLCTGTAAYTAVVLPEDINIPDSSQKVLDKFVAAGGKVILRSEIKNLTSAANITSGNISVFKKKLDNGVLYLLQNEGVDEEKVSVSFPDTEEKNIYEIDAWSGEIYFAELNDIIFKSGEGKVYLVTDQTYSAQRHIKYTNGSIVIDDFCMKRNTSFIIGEKSFEKHDIEEEFVLTKPGDWCKIYGSDFSGEVTYKIEFDFETIPESIEIDLGAVNYSCDIALNGEPLETLCFPPYTCTAEGKMLKEHNTLLVRVANTPANQYAAASFLDEIPENLIGPYHRIAKQFEKESIESGILSSVIIRY